MQAPRVPLVAKGTIPKGDVLAYFGERGKQNSMIAGFDNFGNSEALTEVVDLFYHRATTSCKQQIAWMLKGKMEFRLGRRQAPLYERRLSDGGMASRDSLDYPSHLIRLRLVPG